MLEFITENFSYLMEHHGEKVGLAGIVLLLLGGMVFLGMGPRGMTRVYNPFEALKLALPLAAGGLFLFGVNWYWNR